MEPFLLGSLGLTLETFWPRYCLFSLSLCTIVAAIRCSHPRWFPNGYTIQSPPCRQPNLISKRQCSCSQHCFHVVEQTIHYSDLYTSANKQQTPGNRHSTAVLFPHPSSSGLSRLFQPSSYRSTIFHEERCCQTKKKGRRNCSDKR